MANMGQQMPGQPMPGQQMPGQQMLLPGQILAQQQMMQQVCLEWCLPRVQTYEPTLADAAAAAGEGSAGPAGASRGVQH